MGTKKGRIYSKGVPFKVVPQTFRRGQLPPGPPREILPGGTTTDTGPPSFWGPCRNLYSLLVY